MIRALLLLCCFLLIVASPLLATDQLLWDWDHGGTDWWTYEGNAWGKMTLARAGNDTPAHLESLAGGEQATGTITSLPFRVEGDLLELYANGWDARSGLAGLNYFRVIDAESGEELARAKPPGQDGFLRIQLALFGLQGRMVQLQVVDGCTDGMFAWLGIARIRQLTLDVPAAQSTLKAFVPERVSGLTGAWQLLTRDGGGRTTPPYLSSLGLGESGTGVIDSPVWTLKGGQIKLVIRGWAGREGDRDKTYIELLDFETGDRLRHTKPPLTDSPTPVVWDASDLAGRKVVLRCVDSDGDMSFAWLGLDSIKVEDQPEITFTDGLLPRGWHDPASPGYVLAPGCTFKSVGSLAPIDGQREIPIGVQGRRLWLCGLYSSVDQGAPVWAYPWPNDNRFWLGDVLGSIELVYADGKRDLVPLMLGFTAWWGRLPAAGFTEPFDSSPEARAAKAAALKVAETGSGAPSWFYCSLLLRDKPLEKLVLKDSRVKTGSVVLSALTFETDEESPELEAVPYYKAPAEVVENLTINPATLDLKQVRQKVQALAEVLYTTPADIKAAPKPVVPAGWKGPVVSFSGNEYARLLTSEYYGNVSDMLAKCDADGTWHTSTKDATSWGSYEGFGTWRDGYNSYYVHAWSRDFGRSLHELVELGYVDVANACVNWSNEWLMWYPRQFPELQIDGKPAPAHWSRVINLPQVEGEYGNAENDGHGLMMLFHYKTWLHSGARPEWVIERWEYIEAAAEYILWQMENPDLSGYNGRALLTDSESSGGIAPSLYPDNLCAEGLSAYAKMARTAGRITTSRRWEEAAAKLRAGSEAEFIKTEQDQLVWRSPNTAWAYGHSDLGPLICLPDRQGFVPELADPDWYECNLATYERQIGRCWPEPFVSSVCMGYGQGFITQAALLSDNPSDATTAIRRMAEFIYYPDHQPYITPEGCETLPDLSAWHRTGDLGNGVQEAECLKAIRLVLGVDDNEPRLTRFIPRLTRDLTGYSIKKYPVVTWRDRTVEEVRLDASYERRGSGYIFQLEADEPLTKLEVRVGPFSKSVSQVEVKFVGQKAYIEPCRRYGDANWAWVDCGADVMRTEFTVTPADIRPFDETQIPGYWYDDYYWWPDGPGPWPPRPPRPLPPPWGDAPLD